MLALGLGNLPAQNAANCEAQPATPADKSNSSPAKTAPATPPVEAKLAPGALRSVLRVNVTAQGYNFYQPWEKLKPGTRRGLGSLLADGKVLVTSQLVADATYAELELPTTSQKARARVQAVDYEANLALLTLDDDKPDFLSGMQGLEVDPSAKTGDELEVWQIEDNGTPVSTKGEIVNVDVAPYFLDGTAFLIYELKGSLQYRAGSFVLPVVRNGKLAGLLTNYDNGEQISTVLPGPIIGHFLKDLEDGEYQGFPSLGLKYGRTTDEQLRKYLKLNGNKGGIYISGVAEGNTAAKAGLKEGDVLLELDGKAIDARGNYEDENFGTMNFGHIARGKKYLGEKVEMKILRAGQTMTLSAELSRKDPRDSLIDPYVFDRAPKYYIAGGLVFQELTRPYLQLFGDKWQERAPLRMIHALEHPEELEKKGMKKYVFLSRVIRTPATLGYEELSHIMVTKVNGRPIHTLSDLSDAFEEPGGDVHKIEFSEAPKAIYLDVKATEAVNSQIKKAFRIRDIKRLK